MISGTGNHSLFISRCCDRWGNSECPPPPPRRMAVSSGVGGHECRCSWPTQCDCRPTTTPPQAITLVRSHRPSPVPLALRADSPNFTVTSVFIFVIIYISSDSEDLGQEGLNCEP